MDDDLRAYSEAMTRLTFAMVEARTGIRLGPTGDGGGADDEAASA